MEAEVYWHQIGQENKYDDVWTKLSTAVAEVESFINIHSTTNTFYWRNFFSYYNLSVIIHYCILTIICTYTNYNAYFSTTPYSVCPVNLR